jgi:hypothetical protein
MLFRKDNSELRCTFVKSCDSLHSLCNRNGPSIRIFSIYNFPARLVTSVFLRFAWTILWWNGFCTQKWRIDWSALLQYEVLWSWKVTDLCQGSWLLLAVGTWADLSLPCLVMSYNGVLKRWQICSKVADRHNYWQSGHEQTVFALPRNLKGFKKGDRFVPR